jgi:myo-inositol-1(or 4)-monophosphatase
MYNISMVYQNFLTHSLEEAADIARGYFGKVSGLVKSNDNNQVLTDADIAIGRYLISRVSAMYPTHNVIDEEMGVVNNGSEYTWVIDSIDGTSNFANGVPTYGIIVGLLHGAIPVAGGVVLPAFSQVYIAEKGHGAFCNKERLYVTKEKRLLSILAAHLIDGHQESPVRTYEEGKVFTELVLNVRNMRTSGSVFDAMQLAQGKYGAYLNQTSKIWDNVGVHVICEEAGAIVTDYLGEPIDYSDPLSKTLTNFTVCMSTKELHPQIQNIIHNTQKRNSSVVT